MMLDGSPYQGYLYAYPHKTAYRPLNPRPALRDVWAGERRDSLFLYLHVPFCEMRCGFCNLFTRARPPAEQVADYLDQLRRQAERVRTALGTDARFTRVAIGGGTPTHLTSTELERLCDIAEHTMGASLPVVPLSVETSPATATPDRLAVLARRGASRVSIGVQSFSDAETRAAVRPQRRADVERALSAIRAAGPAVLNLDLIYGIDGQNERTWQLTLDAALGWRPEELFLYPLYVRPLTGLGRHGLGEHGRGEHGRGRRAHARADWDAARLALYRQAVRVLTAAGYRQESMRQFRRADAPVVDGADYRCQDDGMVGLGCGARSYTGGLHYSFDYAVGVRGVRAVLEDYLRRPAADFDDAEVGYALDAGEQRRRWLITSLLRAAGVDPAGYTARFCGSHVADFPELADLVERGWLEPCRSRLTAEGLARSDLIGPWLVSAPVRRAMAEYVAR